jgi:plasmid stabilization system protein ParE
VTARVVVEREADTLIDHFDAWWRENRPAAPNAFAVAIESALSLLGVAPEAGAPFVSRRVSDVRRLVMETGHSLYYRVQGQSPHSS